MGLKEEVMEALRTAEETSLEQLVAAEPGAVRHLFGRLWDPDEGRRRLAAAAIGAAAAAHPGLGVEIVRRLLWALNHEAGCNGVYGISALGEIGARAPDVIAPFVAPLVACAADRGLRPEILRALTRMAAAAPGLVALHLAELEGYVDEEDEAEGELLAALVALFEGEHDKN